MEQALNIRVRGRVQGVGYRRFAQRMAAECKITGWARNLFNGDVEIYAQGDTQSLSHYIEKLKMGPVMGHVDELSSKEVKNENLKGFNILPDGVGE